MSSKNFRRRTSELNIPEEIYAEYEQVCQECESCQRHKPAPPRSRVTGMRANNFGDLVFIDHFSLVMKGMSYNILIAVDAFTNMIWANCQRHKSTAEAIANLKTPMTEWNVKPKCIVGDQYFMTDVYEMVQLRRDKAHTDWAEYSMA